MSGENKAPNDKKLWLKTELVKNYEQVIEEVRKLAKENHKDLKSLYDAIDKYSTLKRFIGHFIMQFKVEVWNKEDEESESMKQTYYNLKEGIKPANLKSLLYCLNCQEIIIPSKGL